MIPVLPWQPLVLVVVVLGSGMLGASAESVFRLETTIQFPELWRLITAHFIHLNAVHAAMNALGLLLCLLIAPRCRDFPWFSTVCLLAVAISIGLIALFPHELPYVGFSGVLYGLYAAVMVPAALKLRVEAVVIYLGIAAWLSLQWLGQNTVTDGTLIGGRLVAAAHVIGFVLATFASCANHLSPSLHNLLFNKSLLP